MALWLFNTLHSFFYKKSEKNVANFTEIDCFENGLPIFKSVMLYILTAINENKKSGSTQGYGYVIEN